MADDAPFIDCDRYHTTLRVPDVPAAVAFYTSRLGFSAGSTWGDPVSMAGVNLGDIQIFLQQGTPHPAGCELHFVVGDADDLRDIQKLKEKHGIDYDAHASYRFVER